MPNDFYDPRLDQAPPLAPRYQREIEDYARTQDIPMRRLDPREMEGRRQSGNYPGWYERKDQNWAAEHQRNLMGAKANAFAQLQSDRDIEWRRIQQDAADRRTLADREMGLREGEFNFRKSQDEKDRKDAARRAKYDAIRAMANSGNQTLALAAIAELQRMDQESSDSSPARPAPAAAAPATGGTAVDAMRSQFVGTPSQTAPMGPPTATGAYSASAAPASNDPWALAAAGIRAEQSRAEADRNEKIRKQTLAENEIENQKKEAKYETFRSRTANTLMQQLATQNLDLDTRADLQFQLDKLNASSFDKPYVAPTRLERQASGFNPTESQRESYRVKSLLDRGRLTAEKTRAINELIEGDPAVSSEIDRLVTELTDAQKEGLMPSLNRFARNIPKTLGALAGVSRYEEFQLSPEWQKYIGDSANYLAKLAAERTGQDPALVRPLILQKLLKAAGSDTAGTQVRQTLR